jgi:prepilin signal peptidase PulO-like enzyme (type II secretory pathway)
MINIYILVFIFGLIVGSFLNVVILRLKKNESIFRKRSHCLFCERKLTWRELIPIFSFLWQKRKCLGCGKKISWQYPLVEFFTGLLFLLGFIYQPPLYGLASIIFCAYLLIVFCFLIIIFVHDLKYYLVADQVIYPAIIISLLFDIYLWISSGQLSILISSLIASLIAGGIFLIIILISKGKWMGMGDDFRCSTDICCFVFGVYNWSNCFNGIIGAEKEKFEIGNSLWSVFGFGNINFFVFRRDITELVFGINLT